MEIPFNSSDQYDVKKIGLGTLATQLQSFHFLPDTNSQFKYRIAGELWKNPKLI